MKPSKFLSTKLIDKLIQPLMETWRLMFLTMNYDLTERQILDLQNNNEFIKKFEFCVRDSLKDYQNTTITYAELLSDIKFNLGYVFNFVDDYVHNLCND